MFIGCYFQILNPSNLKRKSKSGREKLSDQQSVLLSDEDEANEDVDDELDDDGDQNYEPEDEDIEDEDENELEQQENEEKLVKKSFNEDQLKDLWLLGKSESSTSDPIAFRLGYERCRMLDTLETRNLFIEETWNFFFGSITRLCGLEHNESKFDFIQCFWNVLALVYLIIFVKCSLY